MGDSTVVIESLKVIRGEGCFDPSVRAAIEKLFTRWLVRAYIRKYGSGEDEADIQEPACSEYREVLK